MQTSLKHVYITAPIEVAQEAWQEFANVRPGHHSTTPDTIHFIPAQGGCFLVATEPQPETPWPLHALGLRPTGSISERDLSRFKETVEGSSPPPLPAS